MCFLQAPISFNFFFMSALPPEPDALAEQIDDAFFEFMIQKGFYIREGTGARTNPDYQYSYDSLLAEWMKIKKEKFGTTSNTPSQ